MSAELIAAAKNHFFPKEPMHTKVIAAAENNFFPESQCVQNSLQLL
jgi:hypothetical protein